MWNFTRKRQTAGNICLVLFTAFLFSIFVSPFAMVGNAYAATNSGITSVEKQSGSWTEVDGATITANSNGSYALLVSLAVNPLSSVNFNTLNVKFEGASGTVTVYAADMSVDSVYYSTYSKVYSAAYTVPSEFKFSSTNIVYGKVYDDQTYLYSVALTLNSPPPSSPPSSDPTPPPAPPAEEEEPITELPPPPTADNPVVETPVESGTLTQTLDPGTGEVAAELAADDDKLLEQMAAPSTTPDVPKEVAIVATTQAGTTKTTVKLGSATLRKAAETNTAVTVKSDVAEVKLPPASVNTTAKAQAIAAAVSNEQQVREVITQVKTSTPAAAPQTAAQKAVNAVVEQLTVNQTAAQASGNAAQILTVVQEVAKKVSEGKGEFKLSTAKVSSSQAGVADTLGTADNANIKAVGAVLSFQAVVEVPLDEPVNGVSSISVPITEFDKPVEVALDPPSDLASTEGVILIKIENGKVAKTVEGVFDSATGKIKFTLPTFSYWTMAVKVWAFADIIGHWASNDIGVMADAGVVKGVSDNKFAPDATITRAEFATMLVKALGLSEVKPVQPTFKDVNSGEWYYAMVETAARNGLAAGAHGLFNPNANITRQEMAAMITNAMKVQGKSIDISSADAANLLTKFADQTQIASWAKNSVALNVQEGIIVGRTQNTFAPVANATRAEGTVMIKKLLGK